MPLSIGNNREEGDLIDIVAAGEFHRLLPSDYPRLIELRDHHDRALDMYKAAVTSCPVPQTQPTAAAT